MEHRKILQTSIIPLPDQRQVIIEGPIDPDKLAALTIHSSLHAFRRPNEQHEALIEIAQLPEGRIIAVIEENTLVGYVTFHYPDELERWSTAKMNDLIELGAIEIATEYRSYGIGKRAIQLAFAEQQLDNAIVFATEYYWHWDLDGTKLNVWDYRKMMERLMQTVGMTWHATDDPEICSHPANCLMVRIGPEVPMSSIEQFDQLRFQRRFMY
ncbi:GNAT family N-acetyltransferase [Paenibacillus yanchengensis]|uniref:GNAT family N-acetyltransferase n=1 Tax=Paenibacillus yanchengensis TaxID=2035833 RepID=A0ABW4YKJ2_9BACL